MLYALTSAYSRKDCDNCQMNRPLETNIGKLFSIFAWGLDSVREQTELIKLWDNIDNACGTVLDRYGANFGVKRIADDRYYRLAIRVKVMAQLSGGDINTVIWAAASLLEIEPEDVLLKEIYPSKIALYVDQHIISPERLEMIFLIAESIKRIMAAGVGLRLYLCTYRTFREKCLITYFCYVKSRSNGYPVIQSQTERTQIQLSRVAGDISKITSESPDIELIKYNRSKCLQGLYCNVHLKFKRID